MTRNDRISFLECDAGSFVRSVSSLTLCEVRLWPTNVRLVFTRTGLRWSASLLYLLQSDKGVLIDFEQQCCFSFTCYFSLSLIYYLKCTLAWRQHLGILRSLTLDPKKKKKKNLKTPPNCLRLYSFKRDCYHKEGLHFSDYLCFVFYLSCFFRKYWLWV